MGGYEDAQHIPRRLVPDLMGTRPTPFAVIRETADLWHACLDDGWPAYAGVGQGNALGELLRRLDKAPGNRATIAKRLDTAIALGIPIREWRLVEQMWASDQVRIYTRYDDDFVSAQRAFGRAPAGASGGGASPSPGTVGSRVTKQRRADTALPSAPPHSNPMLDIDPAELVSRVVPLLRNNPLSIDDIGEKLGVPNYVAGLMLDLAHAKGASIVERAGRWHLDDAPAMGSQKGDAPRQLVSNDAGEIIFAACGDTHLGSKYYREDCLNDFYDHVAHRGITVVLHAGNWIDGEAPFNKHDLLVHGLDNQMRFLAEQYPRRPGVETWAITGADHEGWYARREGIDVGRYAENVMRAAGRTDWHDMGYMECFIPLVHKATGKSSKLCLMHPGGGSAYAISYAPQKIVEGFDGGDKPAVLLLGHYHKASYNLIRNVHTIQTGCFEDQTVFMRQKKLSAHLGGAFIKLQLDPETGAVTECTYTSRNYFVRDYYQGRFSQHGPVNHAPRSAD